MATIIAPSGTCTTASPCGQYTWAPPTSRHFKRTKPVGRAASATGRYPAAHVSVDDRVKQDDYRMKILKEMAAERRAASRCKLKSKAQCDYAMKVNEYRKRVRHNYPDMKKLAPCTPPNKKTPVATTATGMSNQHNFRRLPTYLHGLMMRWPGRLHLHLLRPLTYQSHRRF